MMYKSVSLISMKRGTANLLVRDIDPALKRQLAGRARAHRRSLSDEVKALIRRGMAVQPRPAGLGTRPMLPDEWRGDDLAFELPKDLLAAR
jgi:plasmid stability protein